MEISPLLLSKLLFFSFAFGVVLGVLNDINRITRAFFGVKYSSRDYSGLYKVFGIDRPKRSNAKNKAKIVAILIFFQDIFLLVVAGTGIIVLNFYFNDGRFRFFTILAGACGTILYYFTVGRLVISLSEPIIITIKSLIFWSIKVITAPFRWIFTILSEIVKNIYKKVRKKLENYTNIRYNNSVVKNYLEQSEVGFVGGIFDEG